MVCEGTVVNEQNEDKSGDEVPRDERPGAKKETRPHEVDGKCSRCGGRWPCLKCLTSTPPYVRVHNNF